MSNLGRSIDPTGRREATGSRRCDFRKAAANLLRILADYGHDTEAERIPAFKVGIATMDAWTEGEEYSSDSEASMGVLNHSLDVLLRLNSKGQEALLRSISATAAHDGELSVAEAELIRAVCATLSYPSPPILVHR